MGCRRRVLPPSVLFLGRRVYWSAVVLIVTALRQGRVQGYTVERLKTLFGVTRPTLIRWLHYFREIFPGSRSWRHLSGRMMPPVDKNDLPKGLIERFVQSRGDPELGLATCLQALALARQGHGF